MRLLVSVDLSESTEKIVDKAAAIATALSAQVWLLHVAAPEPEFVGLDVGPQSVRDSVSKALRKEHTQIQALADRLRDRGLEATALLIQGETADTILKEATRLDADMIVVGSHGRGRMHQLLVGSISAGVLKASKCPVLVVPTHERG
ncbi:universal stress protein [Exilibacterium tricleocarpae]|uniref:Universal stress protein n=1 Tax=Exilibacterium tricleocarpae TaxID=2591008 RepID=A0A545TNH4_9GAMM|nr:universal stress protein [Exilibacterium tricleocarpae]TQV78756.1 universal stress protein [Exilibacterium tricleocarpae]